MLLGHSQCVNRSVASRGPEAIPDRHRSLLCVVANANQRRDLRSEDALQEDDLRFKARQQLRDRDRRVVDFPHDNTKIRKRNDEGAEPAIDATDDAKATVKTIPYHKPSKSRGAEVSGPVLVLVGLTVELERDYDETRR